MTRTNIVRALALAWLLAMGATAGFALLPAESGGEGGVFWHVAAFVTLGVLSRLTFSRSGFLVLLAGLVAFGGAIELAQGGLGGGRIMSLDDLLLDFLGSFAGLAIGQAILTFYRRRQGR